MISIEIFSPDSSLFSEFRSFAASLYDADRYWSQPDDPSEDLHPTCFLAFDGEKAVARACGTIDPRLPFEDHRVAMLGWYECVDDRAASEALLDAACEHYRRQRCDYIIGPMNGSTWNRYRFAEPSSEPPFFLDLHNRPWYASQWEAFGFATIATYHSTRFAGLDGRYERVDALEEKLRGEGITIRSIRRERFGEELRVLYDLSVEGFRGNFLYTPISFDRFCAMYRRLESFVREEYVLIAEADRSPIGFVFAIDNLFERERRSLVMKSAAVLPEHTGRGLGHLLLERVHRSAHAGGYDEIIHALMIERNRSAKILSERSLPYRSYRLFGRAL